MKEIPVYVLTSDNYLKALKGFTYLFNKYWSDDQKVIVYGYSTPTYSLPPNFTFRSLGSQENYPINKWSDALIRILDEIPNDYGILMFEDYWMTRPVNLDVIRALYLYMLSTDDVLKMDLVTDRLYATGMVDYGHIGFIDLIYSDPNSAYQMSMMTGIWNFRILSRLLIPGETPWQLEIDGTHRAAALGNSGMVLGTRQFPVRHILANRGHQPEIFLTEGLKQEDIVQLKAMEVL